MSNRRKAEEILFPELADMMEHNRANLQFGEEAEGQIQRIEAILDLLDSSPEGNSQ